MLREASQGGRMVRLVVGRILQEQEETRALEMPVVQVCIIPSLIGVSVVHTVLHTPTHTMPHCTAI